MDLNNHKLLKRQKKKKIGEAEDRISELPDSLLHHILSFLGTKRSARTSVLSKRWKYIWTSIPKLDFGFRYSSKTLSVSKINKLIEFVDRTLHLHYASNIQKFYLDTNEHFNTSQVHSWISSITSRNVQELSLHVDLSEPFFIPVSLFTCESLTKLKLSASSTIYIPKNFSLPKLKILELCGIQFPEDNRWNEQHFFNCPVLENLDLEDCSWFGVRKFSIFAPALKDLRIVDDSSEGDGLQDCNLKICAPSLVSLMYLGSVAMDYDLSSYLTLDNAYVYFDKQDARRVQRIGDHGAAVSKFFRALSHVQSRLIVVAGALEVISDADNCINNLPTFHNLNELVLILGLATDKSIFSFLKAAPNLKKLGLYDWDFNEDDGDIVYDETEVLFRQLQSVRFMDFSGEGRELRWAKFILKNAKSLQTMTICTDYSKAKNKEVVMSELSSLPRASGRCVFEFI